MEKYLIQRVFNGAVTETTEMTGTDKTMRRLAKSIAEHKENIHHVTVYKEMGSCFFDGEVTGKMVTPENTFIVGLQSPKGTFVASQYKADCSDNLAEIILKDPMAIVDTLGFCVSTECLEGTCLPETSFTFRVGVNNEGKKKIIIL